MTNLALASWIATIVSLSGNVLINKQIRFGFIVWIISNLLWLGVIFSSPEVNYGQATLFAVYTLLSIQGWISWGKGGKKA